MNASDAFVGGLIGGFAAVGVHELVDAVIQYKERKAYRENPPEQRGIWTEDHR